MRRRRPPTAWCSVAGASPETGPAMRLRRADDGLLTHAVFKWLAAQTAQGHPDEAILQALLDAGWKADPAVRVLQLMRRLKSAAVPVLALPVSGGLVDAGDKWVEVLDQGANPGIVVFGNLLSTAECEALISAARPRMARSMTVDTRTGDEELNENRTSEGMFFARHENELVRRVETRIAKLFAWPRENGEDLQILRYGPGAQYKPHYDYFDPQEPGTAALLERGGQRVATLIIYLREPEIGGATVFPDIGLRVDPKRGNGVFFSYAQAHPVSRTLHGGEPVAAGEKWIATKWLRERPFN